MNELTRMQYLAAMGIESFVPRSILPSARLSVACALPEVWIDDDVDEVGIATASTPLRPKDTQEVPASPISQTLVQAILAPSQAFTETPLAATVGSDRTLQQLFVKNRHKSLRFSLSVWQLANGVVMIDSREPKAALPTSALLRNIVVAFARDCVIPQPDFINWPLLHSTAANPSEIQEAQEMTQAFLASRFEMAAPRVVVVMGDAAAKMVLSVGDVALELGNYGEPLAPTHLPCPAVRLPSLSQLLKEPLLKRYIWDALKPWF